MLTFLSMFPGHYTQVQSTWTGPVQLYRQGARLFGEQTHQPGCCSWPVNTDAHYCLWPAVLSLQLHFPLCAVWDAGDWAGNPAECKVFPFTAWLVWWCWNFRLWTPKVRLFLGHRLACCVPTQVSPSYSAIFLGTRTTPFPWEKLLVPAGIQMQPGVWTG